MLAIYKRELKSYFNSMMGYAVLFVFLLLVSIYFWGVNLGNQDGYIGDTLQSVCVIYTIILPILTMRVFAEEKRNKTDQLLFSAPVRIWSIIWGKYLAVVTFFSLPFVVICSMPLVLSRYGTVIFLKSYVAIFVFWLLGCVMLAMGVLASSLTENQIVAAVIGFAANISLFIMAQVANLISSSASASLIGLSILCLLGIALVFSFVRNIIITGMLLIILETALQVVYHIKSDLFEGVFTKVLSGISFYSRFGEFIGGSFSIASVVYYVSFIFLFLYFTMHVIQKRRWS